MTLVYADNCLRCGGDNWIPFRHWRVCADCEGDWLKSLTPPDFAIVPRPVLRDVGIPSRPGPPVPQQDRKAA